MGIEEEIIKTSFNSNEHFTSLGGNFNELSSLLSAYAEKTPAHGNKNILVNRRLFAGSASERNDMRREMINLVQFGISVIAGGLTSGGGGHIVIVHGVDAYSNSLIGNFGWGFGSAQLVVEDNL